MKFVIRPQAILYAPYRVQFDSLDDAIAYAEKLSIESGASVDVLQLIGTVERAARWVPVSESLKKKKMK